MSISHNSIVLEFIETLLFAIILNLNAIRIVMGNLGEILTYFAFFSFVVVLLIDSFIQNKGVLYVYKYAGIVVLPFLLYCILTALKTDDSFPKLVKLVLGLIVAYFASTLSNSKRLKSIYISLTISSAYGIYIILNIQRIIAYVSQRVFNYLDTTLPLGLGLTFLLSIITLSKKSKA